MMETPMDAYHHGSSPFAALLLKLEEKNKNSNMNFFVRPADKTIAPTNILWCVE